MKTMSKILTVIALVVLCVSLFTLTAFADVGAVVTEHVDRQSPSCTDTGVMEYWRDDVGDYYTANPDPGNTGKVTDASTKTTYAALAIPATPHELTHHDAVAATCKAGGNIEYWHCSLCGKNFSDAGGTTEVTTISTAPVAHTPASTPLKTEKAATCSEEGNPEYYFCTVCNAYCDSSGNLVTEITIPKLPHVAGSWSVVEEPTATKGGKEELRCINCGQVMETRAIDPIGVTGENLYSVIAERNTWFRGEEAPLFRSNLIEKLNNESGPNANYVGVRIGTSSSLYANTFYTLDFWSWDQYVELGEKLLRELDAGTYYLWIYDNRNPDIHTESVPFYIVDTPTLEAINTDKHVVNSTKNLRFRASEPIKPGSVKVGGKTLLDDNYYYVSNDGLTITLSPDFLNERQPGTFTISANTVANGTRVSCPFYILSTAGASVSPKTGDESQIGLWAAFLLLSGAAIVVLVPKIRKHGA